MAKAKAPATTPVQLPYASRVVSYYNDSGAGAANPSAVSSGRAFIPESAVNGNQLTRTGVGGRTNLGGAQ